LSAHRTVLGYLLLSRTQPVSIIRHSGVVFEGDQGRKYAAAVGRIVESVRTGLEEVSTGNSDVVRLFPHCFRSHCLTSVKDEVRFMRIRTKRHELMISPGMKSSAFLLIFQFS